MIRKHRDIDDQVYTRFRDLILERSGLHFPKKRRKDLERGLWQAFSLSACQDLDSYYQLLAHNQTSGREWEQLIGHLTVGESYFFRNNAHFQAIREHILPQIIARKRSNSRQIRIWSAGCASGEEPYSLAMVLRQFLPNPSTWNITILATDINRESLARAQAGLYGRWSFREEKWDEMRQRHFTQQDKLWHLDEQIRKMVSFNYLNLVEDPYPALINNTIAFDLILCRNVTIYFTPQITQRVVDQFYEALLHGGWLIVGHSEPSLSTYAQFEARNFPGAVLYQKTGHPTPLDLSWLEDLPQTRSDDFCYAIPDIPTYQPLPEALPADIVAFGAAPFCDNTVQQATATKPATGQITEATPEETIIEAPATLEPESEPIEPIPTPVELCAEAQSLLEQGLSEKALERLHQALEQDIDCAQAYFLIGKSRADSGHWEEARHWCEQALERDVLLTEAHFLLSLIHSQEGNLGQALVAMKRVVYLNRNAALGHFWLANLYEELGEFARARKSLENAAELLETSPPETTIPWSDGMTVGRLRYIVRQQLQTRR